MGGVVPADHGFGFVCRTKGGGRQNKGALGHQVPKRLPAGRRLTASYQIQVRKPVAELNVQGSPTQRAIVLRQIEDPPKALGLAKGLFYLV